MTQRHADRQRAHLATSDVSKGWMERSRSRAWLWIAGGLLLAGILIWAYA